MTLGERLDLLGSNIEVVNITPYSMLVDLIVLFFALAIMATAIFIVVKAIRKVTS